MFMVAHHRITSSEFFNNITDEIMVSVIFFNVCTYEIAEEVHFTVLNSIMKLSKSYLSYRPTTTVKMSLRNNKMATGLSFLGNDTMHS